MQSTDWATIALCVLAAYVEARRGSLTGWTDAVGLVIAIRASGLLYPLIASDAMTPSKAYLLIFCSFIVLIGLVSWQVQTAAAKYHGPVDKVAGALAGLLVGLALSYGMFHYVSLAWGRNIAAFDDSVFRPILHDMVWMKALIAKFSRGGVALKP